MPIAAIYFYEAGFTVLLSLKSKKRNKLEVEDDIEIKLGRQCTYTETCRSNFKINLHYLFVHMLVYNKHLLINMHGMNIKIMWQ